MNGLTMPKESRILDANGKPLITQLPVRVDPAAPLGTVYLIRTTPRHRWESDEDYARHFGIITNVRLP